MPTSADVHVSKRAVLYITVVNTRLLSYSKSQSLNSYPMQATPLLARGQHLTLTTTDLSLKPKKGRNRKQNYRLSRILDFQKARKRIESGLHVDIPAIRALRQLQIAASGEARCANLAQKKVAHRKSYKTDSQPPRKRDSTSYFLYRNLKNTHPTWLTRSTKVRSVSILVCFRNPH